MRDNPLPFASRLPRATGRDHQAPARGRRGRFVIGLFIWIADAHRGDAKRFVVQADEKLTAFLEMESAISVATSSLSEHGDKFRVRGLA